MVTTYDNCADDPQCDPITCPMCMVTNSIGDDPCIDDPNCNNTIPDPCQDDPDPNCGNELQGPCIDDPDCHNSEPTDLGSQNLAKPSLVLQSASNSKEGFIVGAKK